MADANHADGGGGEGRLEEASLALNFFVHASDGKDTLAFEGVFEHGTVTGLKDVKWKRSLGEEHAT